MDEINAVVAGAGIWGATVARRLAESGRKVLVVERRRAAGGNVRCETDPQTGIEVHVYGSHIFHTRIPEVWDFVGRFVRMNGYQHKVLARYRGRTYHLPLGLTLVNKFFGVELAPSEVAGFLDNAPGSPHFERGADRRRELFDAFFRGYTSKQWGKAPEEIDPSVIKRVPVRSNYDTNYFNDYDQGIPTTGYNSLFERMLDHPNISVEFGAEVSLDWQGGAWAVRVPSLGPDEAARLPVFSSCPIDALFGHRFGALPWRTLRFERETLDVADFQGTSVVNYTEAEVPYTRIHEFKHYHPEGGWGFDSPKTVICREYSAQWKPGDEPYYPVDCEESRGLLGRYREELARMNASRAAAGAPPFVCGGRLGEYRYYDMDKSMDAALRVDIGD